MQYIAYEGAEAGSSLTSNDVGEHPCRFFETSVSLTVELIKEETTHSPVKNVTRISNHKELSWVEGGG